MEDLQRWLRQEFQQRFDWFGHSKRFTVLELLQDNVDSARKAWYFKEKAERDKAQHAAEIDALRAEIDALRAALDKARRQRAIV